MERAIITTVVSMCVAIIAVVWIYYGTASANMHSAEKTQRVTACIESGGSWLEHTEDCLQLSK